MAVIWFKFDESYDNRFMTVGGWLGEEAEWKKLEKSWQRRIDFLNRNNRPDQQIKRFHAVYLNRLEKEFKNWTKPMQTSFGKKAISLLSKRGLMAVTIGADMETLAKVFPANVGEDRKRKAYTLAVKFVMVEVAHLMKSHFPGDGVHIVYEKGNWDSQVEDAYRSMIADERWEKRSMFTGITGMTWNESVGLQAADLIAFEAYSCLRSKLVKNSKELRKAVKALLSKGVPLRSRYLDENATIALRDAMEEVTGEMHDSMH